MPVALAMLMQKINIIPLKSKPVETRKHEGKKKKFFLFWLFVLLWARADAAYACKSLFPFGPLPNLVEYP